MAISLLRGTDALVAKMEKEEMELIQRWEMGPKRGVVFCFKIRELKQQDINDIR